LIGETKKKRGKKGEGRSDNSLSPRPLLLFFQKGTCRPTRKRGNWRGGGKWKTKERDRRLLLNFSPPFSISLPRSWSAMMRKEFGGKRKGERRREEEE